VYTRGDVPGLRLIERDIGILRGWIVTSGSRLNKIDRIFIPSSYTFFSEAQLKRNLGLSVLDLE
jgi:hypothetical protein